MIRSTQIAAVNINTSQAKNAEPVMQAAENLSEQNTVRESGLAAGFSSVKKGFDLAQVPARPGLHTGIGIQCCAKGGASCSCSKCSAGAAEKNGSEDEEKLRSLLKNQDVAVNAIDDADKISQAGLDRLDLEDIPELDESVDADQPARLIVDDGSPRLTAGQMKKTDFLQHLKTEMSGTIGPVLATAGVNTRSVPAPALLAESIPEGKSAEELEATVKKYTAENTNASSAAQYISTVTQRASRSAEIWATTGKLSGIPEPAPASAPGKHSLPKAAKARRKKTPDVMTKAKEGGSRSLDDPAAIQKELGAGEPLPLGVRSSMEPAFGTNLSNVRVHTDSTATGLSNRVNARAFTVGNHVAFGPGEFQPGTLIGDALIAHELAHVMQQSGSEKSVDKLEVGKTSYNALEADADRAAMGVVSSLWSDAKVGLKGIAQRTLPMLRSGVRIQRCSKDGGPCSTTETKTIDTAKQKAGGWVTTALGTLKTAPLPANASASLKANFGPTDGVPANLPGITSKIATAKTEMTTVPVTCAGTENSVCANACGYTPGAGAHRYVICRNKTLTPTSDPDFQAGCVLHEAFHSAFSDFSGDSYSGWGGISSSTAGYPGSSPLTNADSYTSLVIDLK